MQKVLVPVDGSVRAEAAVKEAIRLAKVGAVREVHVLNVQANIFSEPSMVYLEPEKMDTYYYQQSDKALAGAADLLRQAGVSFTVHRAVGPVAEIIVERARQLECDAIVMSTRGHGKVVGMLLGSVSNKVLHLSHVPVTLVREPETDFSGRLMAS
ncbi:MAG: universal stress protein [Burkholderiales bacterium]|nr:universal stress protein [Burkholderiales bacterium]